MKVLNPCTEENPTVFKILELRIQPQYYERILRGGEDMGDPPAPAWSPAASRQIH